MSTMSVSLHVDDGVKVRRLTVFDDSGIIVTPLAPPKLSLQVTMPEQRVSIGDKFKVGFKVENVGGLPAQDVRVGIRVPEEGLRVVDPRVWEQAEVGEPIVGEFELEVIESGQHRLEVLVGSRSGGRPSALFEARVDPP